MTFKEWPLVCGCGFKGKVLAWDYDFPLTCPDCKNEAALNEPRINSAHGIVTDGIPGGIMIRHGLCNADGSPRRYDSITDIKREANKRGLIIGGDTPKPYKVAWDGIRTDK